MRTNSFKSLFEESIRRFKEVRIYTTIDHISASGLSARVSASLAFIDAGNGPCLICLANNVKVSGSGDSGFQLAYILFNKAFEHDSNFTYQKFLKQESQGGL